MANLSSNLEEQAKVTAQRMANAVKNAAQGKTAGFMKSFGNTVQPVTTTAAKKAVQSANFSSQTLSASDVHLDVEPVNGFNENQNFAESFEAQTIVNPDLNRSGVTAAIPQTNTETLQADMEKIKEALDKKAEEKAAAEAAAKGGTAQVGSYQLRSSGITAGTDGIRAAAQKIENQDKQIQSDLEQISQIFGSMDSCWSGAAANFVMSTFQKQMAVALPKRQEVMSDVIKYLRSTVASGYEEAEKHNVSLADSFL